MPGEDRPTPPGWVCPACRGGGIAAVLTVPEQMYGTGATFEYVTCAACATIAMPRPPVDMAAHYPPGYYSMDVDPPRVLGRPGVQQFAGALGRSILFGDGRFGRAATTIPQRQLHTLIAVLRAVRRAGLPRGEATRVLDVGCGSGVVVYALGLAGLGEVRGIDPFIDADRNFATGGRLERRALDDVDDRFDLIMFHHSLEHVADPAEELRRALRLLGPAGRILVRMPTVSSAAFERYGVHWVQLDAPRHLVLFSREGVDAMCRRLGVGVDSVVDDSSAFQFWGSEEAALGITLTSPSSYAAGASGARWSRAQIRRWQDEAARLNAECRGDQAAWVLRPG